MDKNEQIIEYLLQCPAIQNSPLYFNFIEAKDGATQLITMTEETSTIRTFVDGSMRQVYTLELITFKSISENAIVKTSGYPNENVDDLSEVQALMDWINEQDDLKNYPNFGENIHIDHIETTTDSPRLMGINTELIPPLAMYSVSIRIEYINEAKCIWN